MLKLSRLFRVFTDREWWGMTRKIQAYRSLQGAHGFDTVIADLAAFCHFTRPTTKVSPVTSSVDPIAMAIAEGRREVFLRICEMMDMDDAKIRAMRRAEADTEQRILAHNEEFQ